MTVEQRGCKRCDHDIYEMDVRGGNYVHCNDCFAGYHLTCFSITGMCTTYSCAGNNLVISPATIPEPRGEPACQPHQGAGFTLLDVIERYRTTILEKPGCLHHEAVASTTLLLYMKGARPLEVDVASNFLHEHQTNQIAFSHLEKTYSLRSTVPPSMIISGVVGIGLYMVMPEQIMIPGFEMSFHEFFTWGLPFFIPAIGYSTARREHNRRFRRHHDHYRPVLERMIQTGETFKQALRTARGQ